MARSQESKDSHAVYMREVYYPRKRDRINEIKKDRKCERCGFSDPRALQFHHKDPSTKKFKISEGAWNRSWARLQEELEKCELLCANCHSIHHAVES